MWKHGDRYPSRTLQYGPAEPAGAMRRLEPRKLPSNEAGVFETPQTPQLKKSLRQILAPTR